MNIDRNEYERHILHQVVELVECGNGHAIRTQYVLLLKLTKVLLASPRAFEWWRYCFDSDQSPRHTYTVSLYLSGTLHYLLFNK